MLLFFTQSGGAQQGSALPPSVVLVLELISKTHVKPTTGVVIHADGLVLVPAEFVSAGAEIVVLDGGTDIARHGRPARTVRRSVPDGLAVLSVEGLVRKPVSVSSGSQAAGERLRFAAFPAAGQLADGAEPLDLQFILESSAVGSDLVLAGDNALPAVAGPLFNRCGQLGAYKLPAGEPASGGAAPSRTLFAMELHDLLSAMDLDIVSMPCGQPEAGDDTPGPLPVEEQPAADAADSEIPEPAGQATPDQAVSDQNQAPDPMEGATTAGQADLDDSQEIDRPGAAARPAAGKNGRVIFLWALALVISVLLAYLLLKGGGGSGKSLSPSLDIEDPGTGRFLPFEGADESGSASGEFKLEFSEELPEGYTAVLLIEGLTPDGSEFKRSCAINHQAFSILAGSSETADLALEWPALAPQHIRIEGTAGNTGCSITVSNLASDRETLINEVPCLPGETWHIGPGDDINLGGVCFRVRLLGQQGSQV